MRHYRTSAFHPRVASLILERIADGESLRRICGPDRAPGMPQTETVLKWLRLYPNFREAYELARWIWSDKEADLAVAMVEAVDRGEGPELLRIAEAAELVLADLAAGGPGQGLEEADGLGLLVAGEVGAAGGEDVLFGEGGPLVGNDEGQAAFAPLVVRDADDGGLADPRDAQ